MPYIAEVKRAVAFLYGTSAQREGRHESTPQGTCFFVSPPSSANESGLWLVTAKHVYNALAATSAPLVRINRLAKATGQPEGYTEIPLDMRPSEWLFHKDDAVDLAVQDWGPHRWGDREVEVYSWPFHGVIDPPYSEIHEGEDITFTGLMLGFPGQNKNLVTIRTGTIALLTDEKIYVEDLGESEYIAINAQCYHGNSGSPVFTGGAHAGTMLFLGVLVYGFAGEEERFPTAQRDLIYKNYGVSLVTPAGKLEDILKEDRRKRHQSLP